MAEQEYTDANGRAEDGSHWDEPAREWRRSSAAVGDRGLLCWPAPASAARASPLLPRGCREHRDRLHTAAVIMLPFLAVPGQNPFAPTPCSLTDARCGGRVSAW